MTIKLTTAVVLAGMFAAGGAALAAGPVDPEATALQSAKVTLPQAIATAEQKTGGQAYDAGVDIKAGQTRIAVETNGPGGVQTVMVDAQSGQVVSAHAGAPAD